MRPPTRCLTCVARHAKCDGRRHPCEQCVSGNLLCKWRSKKKRSVVFYQENDYVSGKAQRPRGPRKANPEPVNPYEGRVVLKTKDTSIGLPSDRDWQHAGISVVIRTAEYRSILVLALRKFYCSYLDGPPSLRSLRAMDVEAFLATYSSDLTHQLMRPILESAVCAVALTVFGQSEASQQAIHASRLLYEQALQNMMAALGSRDLEDFVSDELILATMFLGSYEDKAGGLTHPYPLPSSYRHSNGAAALMMQRLQYAGAERTHRSIVLDTIIRRRVMNTCINRAQRIPQRLREESLFLGSKSSRALDSCMIELSDLKADAMEAAGLDDVEVEKRSRLDTVLSRARYLDSVMDDLQDVMPKYSFMIGKEVHLLPEIRQVVGSERMWHQYDGIGEGRELLWYYATHLRINALILDLFQLLAPFKARCQDLPSSPASSTSPPSLPTQDTPDVHDKMRRIADKIFASVPYLFSAGAKTPSSTVVSTDDTHHLPRQTNVTILCKMIFAMHSLASCTHLENGYRMRAMRILLFVGKATGNTVVVRLYEKGGHFCVL